MRGRGGAELTCLHSNEAVPGIEGNGVDQTGGEKADEDGDTHALYVQLLTEVLVGVLGSVAHQAEPSLCYSLHA